MIPRASGEIYAYQLPCPEGGSLKGKAMQSKKLAKTALDTLIQILKEQGYRVLGPQIRADAVIFDELASAEDLPRGIKSIQEPGSYRLIDEGDERLFDFVHGPESLKRLLFAPEETLWTVSTDGEVRFNDNLSEAPPVAVIGARACDIAGMQVQDRTFLQGSYAQYTDPYYASRRENLFLVAVNCTRSAATCFCTSMDTGPRAREGFDLALTELEDEFLVEVGSAAGKAVAAKLPLKAATQQDTQTAAEAIQSAADSQVRRLDTTNIYELLFDNLEHPRWDDVASRCLSCANCVMVCPTCFCHREYDEMSLEGNHSQHKRQWDACFTLEHGSVHGGHLRPQIKQRYRQWLTHKLGSWIEQFGVSGCVGCGRCITWCPTGIDLTEEVAAIRNQPGLKSHD
ncbi:(NiFe) hydrogenase, beta subunit, putative [Nitrosococcus halophilus Nc 4]|uniref:(NiFe) hydrogenase, beta subunit, putative n=2 Tax=Nitrosococcus halophilus TaxID=133539 RepID=D5C1P8_NITHN|nr:(NiFe) hydrogenase, beta subunit, putative [Nitrosococcus halophilus Nc 4]